MMMFLALLIRLINFDHTIFTFDQSRDAIRAAEILSTDPVKIIGPTTDIAGLFHGSLWWYLLAPFYALGQGNPLVPKLFLVLLHLSMVPLGFVIARKLTKNVVVGLLTAFLVVISFDMVQYSRWLSNPSPAVITVAFFYLGLWKALHKKTIGIGIMVISWALSVQFQLFFLYLLPLLVIGSGYCLYKKDIKSALTRFNISSVVIAGVLLSPFLLSELKFGFQGTQSFMSYFVGESALNETSTALAPRLMNFYDSLVKNVHANVMNFNDMLSQIVLVLLLTYSAWSAYSNKKMRTAKLFLLMWFLAPGVLYPVESNNSYFLNVGSALPLLILTALSLYEITKKLPQAARTYVLTGCMIIITVSNLSLIIDETQHGESLFFVQINMDLADQKDIVDWMYEDSDGENFSVNALTNPLFIHTTWAYHFDTYARDTYDRLPNWAGDPIDGRYAGTDIVLPDDLPAEGSLLYLIIEPRPGIPEEYVAHYQQFEDLRSKVLQEKKFNDFVVQKRMITKPMRFSREIVFEISKGDFDPSTLQGQDQDSTFE